MLEITRIESALLHLEEFSRFVEITRAFSTKSSAHIRILTELVNDLVDSDDRLELIEAELTMPQSYRPLSSRQRPLNPSAPRPLKPSTSLRPLELLQTLRSENERVLRLVERNSINTVFIRELLDSLLQSLKSPSNEQGSSDLNCPRPCRCCASSTKPIYLHPAMRDSAQRPTNAFFTPETPSSEDILLSASRSLRVRHESLRPIRASPLRPTTSLLNSTNKDRESSLKKVPSMMNSARGGRDSSLKPSTSMMNTARGDRNSLHIKITSLLDSAQKEQYSSGLPLTSMLNSTRKGPDSSHLPFVSTLNSVQRGPESPRRVLKFEASARTRDSGDPLGLNPSPLISEPLRAAGQEKVPLDLLKCCYNQAAFLEGYLSAT